jgi:hypothetical protein
VNAILYVAAGLAGTVALVVVVVWSLALWSRLSAPRAARKEFARVARSFAAFESTGGMRCVYRHYDWHAFGNVVMRYEGDDLRAQIICDRNQWFVSLAAAQTPNDELELRDLLALVADDAEKAQLQSAPFELETLGSIASRHFPSIQKMVLNDGPAVLRVAAKGRRLPVG